MRNFVLPQLFYSGSFVGIIIVAALFELVLKGLALWRAARNGDQGWFIVILIINSVGILPIIYLLTHPEKRKE